MLYVGVDIGGMSIKAGLVGEDGKIIVSKAIPTRASAPSKEIVRDLAGLVKDLVLDNGLSIAQISGVGIGSPGSVDDANGVVRYSCNLNFRKTPVTSIVKEHLRLENVKISNDANCAALGETLFGGGKGARNSVTITLGTGIGTGIVCDGKLITGNASAGAEGGHICIAVDGEECGCGSRGCFEAYASVSALIRQTERAAKEHPESALNEIAKKEGFNGKTAFIAMKRGDEVAKQVVDDYIKYIGIGVVNYANIFWPEVFIIGGAISREGDVLIRSLQQYVDAHIYGAEYNPKIKIVAARLGNDAGIVGAATLVMDK